MPCSKSGTSFSAPIVQVLGGGDEYVLLYDQNADGNVDIVRPNRASVGFVSGTFNVDVFLGKGNGSFASGVRSSVADSDGEYFSKRYPTAGDFNSDGIADLALIDANDAAYMYYGLPNGKFAPGPSVSLPNDHSVLMADFNGDGKGDLTTIEADDSGSEIQVRLAGSGLPSWLTQIRNGLGGRIDISYGALTDPELYTRSSLCSSGTRELRTVCGPMYVVADQREIKPGNSAKKIAYEYKDAKVDLDGRGFLGFARREATEVNTGIREVTLARQDFPYVGLASQVSSSTASGETFVQVDTTYTAVDVSGTTPPAYFLYAATATEKNFEISPNRTTTPFRTTVTTSTYGEAASAFYGNLTQLDVRTYAGDTSAPFFQTLTKNTYDNDAVNWYLGRLTRTEVTRDQPGALLTSNRVTTFTYDPTTGLLESEIIEPNWLTMKLTTSYVRDDFGNIKTTVKSTALNGSRTSTAEYSPAAPYFGRFQTKQCNALSQCETRTFYSRTGRVASQTDPNGLTISYGQDNFGRPTTTTIDQSGIETISTVAYSLCSTDPGSCGSVSGTYMVSTSGNDTSYSAVVYDASEREVNRLARLPDGNLVESITDYNLQGYVRRKSAPRRVASGSTYWTTFEYDDIGRMTLEDAPLSDTVTSGRQTRSEFDGLVTTITNPRTFKTIKEVDALGRTVKVTDARGTTVETAYDVFDNPTQTTTTDLNQTYFLRTVSVKTEYDQLGRKTKVDDANMGAWTYEYNAFGDLTKQRDARWQNVTMEYDALGRMTKRTEPEGDTLWYWDKDASGVQKWIGKLAEVTSPNYRMVLSYRPWGGLQRSQVTIGGSTFSTTYSYDTLARLTETLQPTLEASQPGFKVQNQYVTASGLPSFAVQAVYSPTTDTTYWRASDWDIWGKPSTVNLGNGVTTDSIRDTANGQMDTILTGTGSSSNVQNLIYEWDAVGNLETRNDVRGGQDRLEEFSYDSLNRLTIANRCGTGYAVPCSSGPANTLVVTYDGHGSIQSKEGQTYSYAAAHPHAVSQVGATKFTYDLNGNMKTAGARTYAWTSYNLPKLVTDGTSQSSFEYGPDRQRIRQVSTQGTTTDTITYVNAGLEEHRSGTGARYFRHYIQTPDGPVAISNETATTRTTWYLHRDHLGSIDAVTNSSGNVIQRMWYDPFGKQLLSAGDPSLITQWGFAGHEQIAGMSLVHMNGRVYDSAIGRFISADPIVQAPENTQSLNRYSYVMNNPLAYTDPSGYSWVSRQFKKFGNWIGDNWRTLTAIAVTIVAPYLGPEAWGWAAFGGFSAGLIASGGDLRAGVLGAFTAVAFCAVGGTTFGGGDFAVYMQRVIAHGYVGGVTTAMQGGDFADGFLAASFTQAAAPAMGVPSGLKVAAAAVIGGTASQLGGGKFANGAVTGAFSYAFSRGAQALAEKGVTSDATGASAETNLRRLHVALGKLESALRAHGDPELLALFDKMTVTYEHVLVQDAEGVTFAEADFAKSSVKVYEAFGMKDYAGRLHTVFHEFRHLQPANNALVRQGFDPQPWKYRPAEIDAGRWADHMIDTYVRNQ